MSKLIWFLSFPLFVVISWLGWVVAHGNFYKPGDDIGYNLGLVGSLMMLVLLTYTLRKSLKFARNWGQLKYWFYFHMTCGIFGPILVIFHSGFHLHSVNATVAFSSMVIVASSGLIGRYAYVRIHKGMSGSKHSLNELRQEFYDSQNVIFLELKSYPEVIEILEEFNHYALEKNYGLLVKVVRPFVLPFYRQMARYRAKKLLPSKSIEARRLNLFVEDYLYGTERFSQFKIFEQIFSLWHVVHIPLVYLLAATAIWHVIAVHMY